MNHSSKHLPLSPASFCVTVVGSTPVESEHLEDALRRAAGSMTFEIKRKPSAAGSSFPMEVIHAIVFTPTGLAQVMPADVDALRSATKPGTCRVYLWVPLGSTPPSGISSLDDFIQRTSTHGADAVAEQIIAFFREADDLNRRSTLLAFRDLTCLGAYRFLKVLWPVSYVFAALHVLNAIVLLVGRGPWASVLANPYVVPVASFFGAFFIVHCIFVVVRNALFGMRIIKQLNPGFALGGGAFGLAAAATARSIVAVDQSAARILFSAGLAVGAYAFYLYARRIRAQCSSLSQLQAAMANAGRRSDVLNAVGRQPFTSDTFPLLPFRSKSLFISYMHASDWSSETAALIHRWTADHGFEVFMDRSAIPSGSLWRQLLLRAISECGYFVAVLDGDAMATEWVMAESAYAALLRKNIGKPRILLVVRNAEGVAKVQQNPFRVIYLDVFQLPPELCYGAAILPADHGELTAELILRALEEVRPICLLPGFTRRHKAARDPRRYAHKERLTVAQFVNCFVIILLVPPVVFTLYFSSPVCFFAFCAASVIPFFAGKSRRVTDPIAGVPMRSELSPRDFHAWAKLVCSSDEYQRAYDQYVYDTDRGYDQKPPVTFSQIKAINYIHAWKVLLFILLALDTFCLYDIFFSNQTVKLPVAVGIIIWILWGYALGVYVLWRKCRRYKAPGDLPL